VVRKAQFEVADIFRDNAPSYSDKQKLPLQAHKIINAITSCRTKAMGQHIEKCDCCGHEETVYNSCRNRHCPKCQGTARKKWYEQKQKELLPVDYYHLVFTLPRELEPIALRNKRLFYGLMFKAVSQTLLEVARERKFLGAQIGFTAILHTWTQTLLHHPHIHCVVPGGGLSFDNKEWISCRNGFFLPVRVLSRLYRGKLLAYLKEAFAKGELNFCGAIEYLGEGRNFQGLLSKLYQKDWVVYSKPPFGSTEQVLKYISSYVHRIAISNNRIINIKGNTVTFRYRDSRDENKQKEMTISSQEFRRRFLLHILPSGFMKIRYYGFLSNRNRRAKLISCRFLLLILGKKEQASNETGEIYHSKCPKCRKGFMRALTGLNLVVLPSKKIA